MPKGDTGDKAVIQSREAQCQECGFNEDVKEYADTYAKYHSKKTGHAVAVTTIWKARVL